MLTYQKLFRKKIKKALQKEYINAISIQEQRLGLIQSEKTLVMKLTEMSYRSCKDRLVK